jgi:hypothetical protein
MDQDVISTAMRVDRQLRVQVRASGALFRYSVEVWMPWSPEWPHDPKPGYWSPRHVSGFYDSAEAALRDAIAIHHVEPGLQE